MTQDTQRRVAAKRVAVYVAVFTAYLLLSCLLYWPIGPLDGRHLVNCVCSDPEQEVWFLRWTPFAIAHGQNPFFTHQLDVPFGVNLGINTSMPLLGVLAWPITAATNAVAGYNALLRLGIALSALSMFAVTRRYTRWWPASFAAGLLFGFSPFMTAHAQRHLFLVFLPLVPLFIPLVEVWLVRGRRRPLLWGAAVGLVAALEYLISPEVLLLTGIAVVVALAALAIRHRRAVSARLHALAVGLAGTIATFVVVAGYPLWMLLAGPRRPTGPPHPISDLQKFHADVLAPLLPTRNLLLAASSFVAPTNHIVVEKRQELGFYLGIPLLVLLVYAAYRLWHDDLVLTAISVAGVGYLVGLGTPLTFNGHRVVSPFLFRIVQKLPVLQDLEAARFSMLVQLGAALLLGIALDRWRRHGPRLTPRPDDSAPHRWRPALAGALGVLVLVPLLPRTIQSFPTHAPALFTTAERARIPWGATALTYPLERSPHNNPMLWQALAGMRFRLIGGDAFQPDPNGQSDQRPTAPLPASLVPVFAADHHGPSPTISPLLAGTLRQFLQRYDVRVVILDTRAHGAAPLLDLVTRALGRAPTVVGAVDLWRR